MPDLRRSVPCQTDHGALWFSDSPADRAAAVEACLNCPRLRECQETDLARELALPPYHQHGVIAGVDLENRVTFLDRRTRAARGLSPLPPSNHPAPGERGSEGPISCQDGRPEQ